MVRHDIKADIIIVSTLTRLTGKITAKVNITYGEARELGEYDLVYRKYIDAIVTGIANPKTTIEVSGPVTINWSGVVPSGGQTFAQKHGNAIHFQGYYEQGGLDIAYMPSARITRDAGGNITQVEFGDVFPGTIVII